MPVISESRGGFKNDIRFRRDAKERHGKDT